MKRDRVWRDAAARLAACMPILGMIGCAHVEKGAATMDRDHMILDRLENAGRYEHLHPAFARAFAFLRRPDLADLPPGRYEIDGARLYCSISKVPGRTRAEAPLEAHRKYIDIQYVIAGTETMGWKPTRDCRAVSAAYDPAQDIGFFADEPASWTEVPPGSFVIFFPQDAHAPLVGSGEIHKAVLKIAVE